MGPLKGITVLDFTQAYNGPYCAMALADNGARIIKVERPSGGDQSRYWGPYPKPEIRKQLHNNGNSGYFAVYNRNKESIAVDLRSDEGRNIILDLFKKVDVVLENFKYGTMGKLGLGYETAREVNPEIVFVSASGYGQTGPLRTKAAYDNVIECMSGYMQMTGFADRLPIRSGASVGDSYTGLTAFLGTVLACYRKKLTGKGGQVDVSMMDTMFAANETGVLTYSLTGKPAMRAGNARPYEVVPYDTFYCVDGMIATGISDESQWPAFCKAIDRPELIDDPRFATNDDRCANYEIFTGIMKDVFASRTKATVLEAFAKAQVPASELLIPLQALNDSHFIAREMVVEMDDANVGTFKTFGLPIKYGDTKCEITKGSPLLGEDTESVMREIGMDDETIHELISKGVLGTPESTEKFFE